MSTLWLRVSAVIISDAKQAFADSGAPFIVTQHTNFAHGKWEKLLGSTNIWKDRAEMGLSGTCGVYDVSVGLRSTAGLHTDTHILPL